MIDQIPQTRPGIRNRYDRLVPLQPWWLEQILPHHPRLWRRPPVSPGNAPQPSFLAPAAPQAVRIPPFAGLRGRPPGQEAARTGLAAQVPRSSPAPPAPATGHQYRDWHWELVSDEELDHTINLAR